MTVMRNAGRAISTDKLTMVLLPVAVMVLIVITLGVGHFMAKPAEVTLKHLIGPDAIELSDSTIWGTADHVDRWEPGDVIEVLKYSDRTEFPYSVHNISKQRFSRANRMERTTK